MNIVQASSLTGGLSPRTRSLLTAGIGIAPLFQVAEFRPDASTHLVIKDSDSYTSSAARAENAAKQKDNQVPSTVSRSLALYSRQVGVDEVRKLDANLGVSPAGLRMFADRKLSGLNIQMFTEIQQHMITGSDASNEMLGFNEFIKDAAAGGQTAKLNFTTAELAAMNTQIALQLNTTANQDTFLENLEKELAKVPGANAIIVNSNLGPRINTIARRLQAAGESKGTFGLPFPTINNVKIIVVPTTVIPQTQSDGTNSDCTSAYVVRFAEEGGVAFATNSGFYFKDFDDFVQDSKIANIAELNFFLNLYVDRNDAIRRLSRIRL